MAYRRNFHEALSILAEYHAGEALDFLLESAISMPIPIPGCDGIRQCVTDAIMAHRELHCVIIDCHAHILKAGPKMHNVLASYFGKEVVGECILRSMYPDRAHRYAREIAQACKNRERQYFLDNWEGLPVEVMVYPLPDARRVISRLMIVSRLMPVRRFIEVEIADEGARIIE